MIKARNEFSKRTNLGRVILPTWMTIPEIYVGSVIKSLIIYRRWKRGGSLLEVTIYSLDETSVGLPHETFEDKIQRFTCT